MKNPAQPTLPTIPFTIQDAGNCHDSDGVYYQHSIRNQTHGCDLQAVYCSEMEAVSAMPALWQAI